MGEDASEPKGPLKVKLVRTASTKAEEGAEKVDFVLKLFPRRLKPRHFKTIIFSVPSEALAYLMR